MRRTITEMPRHPATPPPSSSRGLGSRCAVSAIASSASTCRRNRAGGLGRAGTSPARCEQSAVVADRAPRRGKGPARALRQRRNADDMGLVRRHRAHVVDGDLLGDAGRRDKERERADGVVERGEHRAALHAGERVAVAREYREAHDQAFAVGVFDRFGLHVEQARRRQARADLRGTLGGEPVEDGMAFEARCVHGSLRSPGAQSMPRRRRWSHPRPASTEAGVGACARGRAGRARRDLRARTGLRRTRVRQRAAGGAVAALGRGAVVPHSWSVVRKDPFSTRLDGAKLASILDQGHAFSNPESRIPNHQ